MADTPAKPRRRWLRFSLRTMLLAVLCAAAASQLTVACCAPDQTQFVGWTEAQVIGHLGQPSMHNPSPYPTWTVRYEFWCGFLDLSYKEQAGERFCVDARWNSTLFMF
jgi:hypothetical protein